MAATMIKVAALSGSLRKASYHSGLIRAGSLHSFSFSFFSSILSSFIYMLINC
jgi:hypothetical protein